MELHVINDISVKNIIVAHEHDAVRPKILVFIMVSNSTCTKF
ncbi:hypothetical protein SDC9_192258 [bioreactor metagenome]|uniref:Uncharacterized protein n=1 Tax=bioreactor metagenome TaxID=1076179 RepID=A0A645IB98_9ZZZZ